MDRYLDEAERMILNGQVSEGLDILNDLLFDEPGYGVLHSFLGWANMYFANDVERAEMHFRMAMRFTPGYAPPYLHMGNLMNRSGRYAEAIHFFREGLSRPDALTSALMEGMALAYELRGDYGNAVRAYKDAARASAADFDVNRLLSGVKRCRRKRLTFFFSF